MSEDEQIARSKSIAQLRKDYPGEASCHRSMMTRVRDGAATVHPRFTSFRSFLVELGARPGNNWTLDRIDPSDPEYAPGKVRWADKQQQANNRTNTIKLSVEGQVRPLTSWARQTGQNANTMRQRLGRGWSHEEAVYPSRRHNVKRPSQPVSPSTENLIDNRRPPPLSAAFEAHYSKWHHLVQSVAKGAATRNVFGYWISRGRSGFLLRRLEARYPDHFGSEAVPIDDDPAIGHDQEYQLYCAYNDLGLSLRGRLSAAEWAFFQQTLRQRQMTEPHAAVSMFSKLMKGTKS